MPFQCVFKHSVKRAERTVCACYRDGTGTLSFGVFNKEIVVVRIEFKIGDGRSLDGLNTLDMEVILLSLKRL